MSGVYDRDDRVDGDDGKDGDDDDDYGDDGDSNVLMVMFIIIFRILSITNFKTKNICSFVYSFSCPSTQRPSRPHSGGQHKNVADLGDQ